TGAAPTQTLAEDVVALESNGAGIIYAGHRDGRVGEVRGDTIYWHEGRYPGEVTGFSYADNELMWVFTERTGVSKFGETGEENLIRVNWSAPGIVDAEGVSWLATRAGLTRYLGDRFTHYSLPIDGESPAVFAIEPGTDGDYWFGTGLGLVHVTADGEQTNVSDDLGLDRREVRGVRLAPDRRTLYAATVNGLLLRIDTQTMTMRSVLDDAPKTLTSLSLDGRGHVWAGSYYGKLYHYDPENDTSRAFDAGDGAGIYAMDIAADGTLWAAANYRGLLRLDTAAQDPAFEQVLGIQEIGKEFFTHLVAEPAAGDTAVWFSSLDGGAFRWQAGALRQVIEPERIDDKTVFALAPLRDGTVVLSSGRGIYHYAPASDQLEYYTDFEGYTALEGKVRAMHLEADGTLWIGTTNGATAMDTTLPMMPIGAPRPRIVSRSVNGELMPANGEPVRLPFSSRVRIDYSAISTRRPNEIAFSYRLAGRDDDWSAPSTTTSLEFSGLSAGDYVFEVRARFPAGDWSEPQRWAFSIPMPYYQTPWFIALVAFAIAALTWLVVRIRVRSVARLNQRLRREVAERTESIEQQRRELESINGQLSSEIEERRKADEQRAELEQRFHQAYHNSPVGMALVDVEGLVYDANPTLKALFWPNAAAEDRAPVLSVVADSDRTAFASFLEQFWAGTTQETSMEVDCIAHSGEVLRIDFIPSAVRNAQGELQYVVLSAKDVTESRELTRRLEYQASFDELTGLINRRAFAERLAAVEPARGGEGGQDSQGGYLMFLDLDQFKVVNDTCGHAAGDELLRKVARLLTVGVRETDTVARLGGDEFGLVLVGCSEEVAMRRAEDIRQRVADLEFVWQSEVFRIGVSIGVVPIVASSQDLDELQQLADAACYAAKDAGRNRVHLVSGQSDTVHEQRGEMRWVQRLNTAIDTDSFELFGQRIVTTNAHANERERIEVLLRMKDHSTGRLIPPGAFLPAAERYGLQARLDQWVVNRVIELLSTSHAQGETPRRYWINLSGASVGDPNFSSELIRRVSEASLPAGTLNFEITETAVIRKIEDAGVLIAALRDMGCHFALDDFGSGLSSFGYLKRLNVDTLKIDGQFIRDITTDNTDRIFVKSIIDIAHTLRMRVVAEFVEDDSTLAIVRDLGCDYAQGFGVHRPEPLRNLVPGIVPDQSKTA
ncbi:MAG: EAL domain-containing protein, partial [Pseudomonadota bacterium]